MELHLPIVFHFGFFAKMKKRIATIIQKNGESRNKSALDKKKNMR